MEWFDLKVILIQFSGLSRDALHVLLGVSAQVLVASVPGQSLARFWPWLAVLAGALLNEWYDLNYETWPEIDLQYAESIKDVTVTMALPTLLLLLARFAPRVWGDRGR